MVKARTYIQSNSKRKENSAFTLLNLAGGLRVLKKDCWHYLRVQYLPTYLKAKMKTKLGTYINIHSFFI